MFIPRRGRFPARHTTMAATSLCALACNLGYLLRNCDSVIDIITYMPFFILISKLLTHQSYRQYGVFDCILWLHQHTFFCVTLYDWSCKCTLILNFGIKIESAVMDCDSRIPWCVNQWAWHVLPQPIIENNSTCDTWLGHYKSIIVPHVDWT